MQYTFLELVSYDEKFSIIIFIDFYQIHFEITDYPCNVIGSQPCNSFTNRTIFALNRIFFSVNENGTVKQNNQSDFKAFLT